MAAVAVEPILAEIGRQGCVIPLPAFRARVGGEVPLRKILAALTITEKVHPGRPRGMARTTRRAYLIEGQSLIIPRIKVQPFLKVRGAAPPLINGIRPGSGANAPLPQPRRVEPGRLALEVPLYSYQEAAVAHLCRDDAPASVYLQMDTGLGKSRLGCGVVAARGVPAVIVVPTDAIAVQWVDEFREILPKMSIEIYRNPPKGSRKVPPGPNTHDVVVIIVNTFREKTPDFMEGYGTAILDEVHEYHSAHNSKALWLTQGVRFTLGLSATPEERPDGMDRFVHLVLGPVLFPSTIPDYDVGDVHFSAEVRLVEYEGHPDHCETASTPSGTMSAILTIGNIIKDRARARLVAAEVDRLCHLHETADAAELARLGLGPRPESAVTPQHPLGEMRRHGVFVFAEHREYLPTLQAALLERFQPGDILAPELEGGPATATATAVSILRGGVAKTAVGAARRAGAHIVLTTYGFSRRGISLPEMTAIVKATPRRNGTRQILGRIFRRGSDESILRQIVDIIDIRTGLRSQATDRKKIYKSRAYPITRVSASWETYTEAGAAAGEAGAEADTELQDMSIDDLLEAAMGAPGEFDVGDILD